MVIPLLANQDLTPMLVKLGCCNSSVIDFRSCATDVDDFYSF